MPELVMRSRAARSAGGRVGPCASDPTAAAPLRTSTGYPRIWSLLRTAASPGPPVGPIRFWRLALIAAGVLILLGVVGLGWTLLAFRRWLRPVEVLEYNLRFNCGVALLLGVLLTGSLWGWLYLSLRREELPSPP